MPTIGPGSSDARPSPRAEFPLHSFRMQSLQQAAHGATHDYRAGSPHLKHWRLYDRLVSLVRAEIDAIRSKGLPLTVLEVGAGHGGFTEPMLALGCSVKATEMSQPSLAVLTERYRSNPKFAAVFDADGSLTVVGNEMFSVVICASVLHHIPDYRMFLDSCITKHLAPGGALITLQDPLWYAGLRPSDVWLSQISYFAWRITLGEYAQGVSTRLRRISGRYDEQNPLDMVEYHVVRSGVNHREVLVDLTPRFDSVRLVPYWSTQSGLFQRLGESLRRTNSFALVARGFRRDTPCAVTVEAPASDPTWLGSPE